jgi:hypothetical protein
MNTFFGFGFNRGQIDFGKARFVEKVVTLQQFKQFPKIYGKWVEQVIEYRDAVIHQKSIDITGVHNQWLIPSRPLSEIELEEFQEKYETFANKSSNSKTKQNFGHMNLLIFMKMNIENLRNLSGLLSTEILNELRTKYPDHAPSCTYYADGLRKIFTS